MLGQSLLLNRINVPFLFTNVHAHFFLGAHRFWVLQDINRAIPHLEICVRLHPNFLRGWGCLGAIYKQLGNTQLARRAFEKCAQLENNSRVKDFFIQQMKAA